jgi:hypothetical protein
MTLLSVWPSFHSFITWTFLDLFVLEKGACMIVVHWYTCFFMENVTNIVKPLLQGHVCTLYLSVNLISFEWGFLLTVFITYTHVRMHSWVMILIKRYNIVYMFSSICMFYQLPNIIYLSMVLTWKRSLTHHLRQNPDVYRCNK